MQINSPLLLIEINNLEFIFFVVDKIKEEKFHIIHKESISIKGNLNEKISNQDTIFAKVKERIYLVENKFNLVFEEVILIIDDFNFS